jgi:hypothetical protein
MRLVDIAPSLFGHKEQDSYQTLEKGLDGEFGAQAGMDDKKNDASPPRRAVKMPKNLSRF